jgi:hypothetical protein
MAILAQYHGIEVEVTDQNSEAVTIQALYGQPFTADNGENTNTATVSPFELSEPAADPAGLFHVSVFC